MPTMLNRSVISGDIIDYVLCLNDKSSVEHTNPSAQLARQLYRQKHPTEILVNKCMDGRLNLALMTNTPPGIIQPFRNIGGRFDLGWPFFQEVIVDAVNYGITKGRQCISMSSYHFAAGEHHRGCAGFGYDTEGAKNAAFELRDQFTRVFGGTPMRPVYALTIGIETDNESLIFHGQGEETLDVLNLDPATSKAEIDAMLATLYPDMNSEMRRDLLPLIEGNMRHIQSVKEENKPLLDLQHREQIIAVGRGFDWLHEPNRALIVGPYSHQWPSAVKTAGDIALSNIKEGRIPKENGVLLLISALWRREEGEVGRRSKEEKVRYLAKTSLQALEGVPELGAHLKVLCGVVDADTRKLHVIE